MAIDTRGWTMSDFGKYFRGSHRVGGSSAEFKAIRENLTALESWQEDALDENVASTQAGNIAQAIEACKRYQQNPEITRSSKGAERLEVIEQFLRFAAQYQARVTSPEVLEIMAGQPASELDNVLTFEQVQEYRIQKLNEVSGKMTRTKREAKLEALGKIDNLCDVLQTQVDLPEQQRAFGSAVKQDNVKQREILTDKRRIRLYDSGVLEDIGQPITKEIIEQYQQEAAKYDRMPVSEESALSRVNALSNLMDACDIYMEAHQNEPQEKAYIESLKQLKEVHTPNLSKMRDMRVVRQYAGRSWEEFSKEKEASYRMEGPIETVGANVNQRIKMTYNGKKGFFTESETVLRVDQVVDRTIERLAGNDISQLIAKNRRTIEAHYEGINSDHLGLETFHRVEISRIWDQMEPSPQKEMLKEFLRHEKGLSSLTKVIDTYQQQLKAVPENQLNDFKRMQIFDKVINSSNLSPDAVAILTVNSKALRTYAETAPLAVESKGTLARRVKLEEALWGEMLRADMSTEAGREAYAVRRELAYDEAAKTVAVDIIKKANSLNLATGESGNLEYGAELTGRNVASTRIAELLGVGGLLAHSEQMTVEMADGRKVSGCFMEFAEGIDLRNGDERTRQLADQVQFTRNAGFTKDACGLEVLDFICAQGDRHGGNMFVKLGEVQADGTRNIVGIQGIDNDLAFSTDSLRKDKFGMKQGDLEDLYFIDEALAQKVKGLDRAKLQAAVGDILDDKEMDALVGRVERMQKHIDKQMIQLKDDQWNLDADITKMDKSLAERYQAGINGLDKSMNALRPWDIKHKDNYVKRELENAKAANAKAQAKEAEISEGMTSMFAEAEAGAERYAEALQKEAAQADQRTVRAAKFDQIVAAAEKSAPVKAEPVKGAPQATGKGEKISRSELEEKERSQRAPSFKVGSHRERARQLMQEKELQKGEPNALQRQNSMDKGARCNTKK